MLSTPSREPTMMTVADVLSDISRLPIQSGQSARKAVDALVEAYWLCHPRYRFFKTLPEGATVLDAGAGSGGMVHWKSWGALPERPDLALHVFDREKGEFFDLCAGYRLGDLEGGALPYASGAFDAVMLSHVIEYLSPREAVVRALATTLKPGGLIYVETANPDAVALPTGEEFRAAGFPVGVVNYFDDPSARQPLSNGQLRTLLQSAGFEIREGGDIANPYLANLLCAAGRAAQDGTVCTFGLALRARRAHYVVAEYCPS
jgi:SAM-dependent methyltransferase